MNSHTLQYGQTHESGGPKLDCCNCLSESQALLAKHCDHHGNLATDVKDCVQLVMYKCVDTQMQLTYKAKHSNLI